MKKFETEVNLRRDMKLLYGTLSGIGLFARTGTVLPLAIQGNIFL